MGTRLSVLQKGLILIAIPLAFQLGFIALLINVQQQEAQASRRAYDTSAAIAQFYRVLTTLIEAQNALRGFVLIGDAGLDRAFQGASQRFAAEADRLRELVAGDAEDEARAQRIKEQGRELLDWLEGTAQATRRGERDAAITRIGKRGYEPVARELDAFLSRALTQDAARQGVLAATERRMVTVVVGGTLIVFVLAAALAWFFSRDIASRLSVVADNTRRLSAGEPLQAPLSGDDEIARVDAAFRRMSEALRAAREQERLHRAELERKAVELEVANRELRLRNEENELFVYSVSHDLRSPLVNLQGFSRELRRACEELETLIDAPGMPEPQRERARAVLAGEMAEAIHFITTAVSRLGTIIDALLGLSRIGRVEYRPQTVDVNTLVARVIDSLRATIVERGVEVVVHPLPRCWGDPVAIDQVFANLLDNAIKYLDAGERRRVEVGSRRAPQDDAQRLQTYYVRDTGVGIAESDQSKIFLPFQRLHTAAAIQGEGIGLAVVRRIAERHGGRVWLESRPGEGSTFFVSFPAGPAASAAAAAPPLQAEAA